MTTQDLVSIYQSVANIYIAGLLSGNRGNFLADLGSEAQRHGVTMEIDTHTLQISFTNYHPDRPVLPAVPACERRPTTQPTN